MHIYLYIICTSLLRLEGVVGAPGTGVTGAYEPPPTEGARPESSPLEEQQALLTAELFLQPLLYL